MSLTAKDERERESEREREDESSILWKFCCFVFARADSVPPRVVDESGAQTVSALSRSDPGSRPEF